MPAACSTAEKRIFVRDCSQTALNEDHQQLIGSIDMEVAAAHQLPRQSYWMGVAYWNQGYCTEALQTDLD